MPRGLKGFQKGLIPWNKGKKLLKESIRKRTIARKLNGWNKNPEKTKEKQSNSLKGNKNGLGYKFTKKQRTKASISHKGKQPQNSLSWKGKEHPNWRGGKSFEPYTTDWTESLRISIRERDNYICQLCDKRQGDRVHSIHHIDYNKSNCNPDNLITLCVNCNSKVNFNKDYWINYFKGRIIKTLNQN